MLGNLHLIDDLLDEDTDVIRQYRSGRDYHDLQLGVIQQPPDHIGRSDVTLTYTPKRFNPPSPWSMLNPMGNVVLDRSGRGEIEEFPGKGKKVAEILLNRINLVNGLVDGVDIGSGSSC